MLNELRKRALPELLPREEMLRILLEEEYGALPAKPSSIRFEDSGEENKNFLCGKARYQKLFAVCELSGKSFSFPFYVSYIDDGIPHPFFVHVNFRDNVPDLYMPTEELIDNGFSVLSFCYKDITSDNGDFSDGLAGVLYENGVRGERDCGKISMWAWAAHRVMDYAESRSDVFDLSRAAVCGHSRLGKTALLASATDTRFAFAYSNDSGCSGAAVSRGKEGETVGKICARFPYWFSENYKKYADKENEMPFDQHYLIASIAPRRVLVGSASEDIWADPRSEQLACFAASAAFDRPFACPDREANIGESFLDGDVGYHLRRGKHFYGRADWHKLMEFIRIHSEK